MWRRSLCATLCVTAVVCAAISEDRALQQALKIVQLLRAEYGRSFLRMTETPAPTCAPTTALRPAPAGPSRRHWTTWYSETFPQRRFDYNDVFGEHPSSVIASPPSSLISTATNSPQNIFNHDPNTPTSVIQQSLTPVHSTSDSISTSTLLVTLPSSITTTSTLTITPQASQSLNTPLRTKFSQPLKISHPPTRDSNITSVSPQSQIKLSAASATTSGKHSPKRFFTEKVQDSPAPELQQMAMELAVEIKADGVRPALLDRSAASKRLRAKATWREHLARSTRYAVPLPENHAFCYIDPHNALCRTII